MLRNRDLPKSRRSRVSIQFLVRSVALFALCAGLSGAQVAATARNAQIVLGEPLVIDLAVQNTGDSEVVAAQDYRWIERTSVGSDGRSTSYAPKRPDGDYAYFSVSIGPHETKTLTVVASETASLPVPGQYRMTLRLHHLGVETSLEFTVLPYERAELVTRTEKVYAALIAAKGNEDVDLAEQLAGFAPVVSTPFVCRAMKAGISAQARMIKRLEEIGGSDAASCMIEALPELRDEVTRQTMRSSLSLIASRTRDATLKRRIAAELALNR